jgi:hypothetical protein
VRRRDLIKSAVVGSSMLSAGMLASVGNGLAATIMNNEKNLTAKKSLIIYASRTNNTTKVAERFKSTLEKNGWQCDVVRIEKDSDPMTIPFNYKNYDLICAGSGIRMHSPYVELLHVLRVPVYGFDPRIMLKMTEGVQLTAEENKKMQGWRPNHRKITAGPNAKKALSFVTYGGYEFGPDEAQPALDWINLELAHLEVEIVGKFCCPGKFEPMNNPAGYHNDLITRPNDRDLLRAELFIEQTLEAIAERSAKQA